MLKIILVDDHEIVRLGLKSLLQSHPMYEVVAEADNAKDAIDRTMEYKPDVVVMDIRMPGKSGIEATREIVDQLPETKVIMLTSYADDELLFDAIRAGASGYVLKQIGSAELLDALEKIGRGEAILDPELTQKVFRQLRKDSQQREGKSFASLTERELSILWLVSEGKKNKEIAEEIFLSEKTVRNYVSSILSKLDLSTRAEAAGFAVRHNIEDHMN